MVPHDVDGREMNTLANLIENGCLVICRRAYEIQED
jgi:hypothetical protein